MNITEEDAVSSFASSSSVIKSECDDVLHVLGVLEWFYGGIQVVFVGQVNALQYGALRVEKVAIVVAARAAVFSQHAMGAGTRTLSFATVKAKLLTSAIVFLAHICSCKENKMQLNIHLNDNIFSPDSYYTFTHFIEYM